MTPTFDELISLAAVEGAVLHDIKVFDSNAVVARALATIVTRRHHGLNVKVYELYTGRLHDYVGIFAKDEASLNKLVALLKEDAKRQECDVVVIESAIAAPFNGKGCLHERRELKVFDSTASKDGWGAIYNKKSCKRFVKDACRAGDYKIEVSKGELSAGLMEELRKLHIRRWTFAGSSSAFSSMPYRVAQYMNYPGNKMYLRIMLGSDILACHYGMVYADSLLWHTPVINPKYLRLSPLRILLAETARWCEKNGISKLDFGLGDEKYKDEYCTSWRTTLFREYPLSIKGLVCYITGTIFGNEKVKAMIGRGLDVLRSIRDCWQKFFEKWLFYVAPENAEPIDDSMFFRISSWESFCDFTESRNFPIYEWQWMRFKGDKSTRFVALADGHQIYSYGWESNNGDAYVKMPNELKGRKILYDFCTPMEHRGKGWYTRLLKRLGREGKNAVIYVLPKNLPSKTAIESAGFRRWGEAKR